MPDDAKLGLLAGVIGVVVVATVYHQKPAPPETPVATAPVAPSAAVPARLPVGLDQPVPTRPEVPAVPASYTRE